MDNEAKIRGIRRFHLGLRAAVVGGAGLVVAAILWDAAKVLAGPPPVPPVGTGFAPAAQAPASDVWAMTPAETAAAISTFTLAPGGINDKILAAVKADRAAVKARIEAQTQPQPQPTASTRRLVKVARVDLDSQGVLIKPPSTSIVFDINTVTTVEIDDKPDGLVRFMSSDGWYLFATYRNPKLDAYLATTFPALDLTPPAIK